MKRVILENLVPQIKELAETVIQAYRAKKKVVLFRNGGSAADAQRIACELVERLKKREGRSRLSLYPLIPQLLRLLGTIMVMRLLLHDRWKRLLRREI